MQILQNVDLGTLLLLTIGCVFLCVIGLLLFFGLQILGTGLNAFLGVFHLLESMINGGPGVWCGCLVLVFGCAIVLAVAYLAATCGSNPSSMNFCLLFPK